MTHTGPVCFLVTCRSQMYQKMALESCMLRSNHFLHSDSEKWGTKTLKDCTESFRSATSSSPAFLASFQSVGTGRFLIDAGFFNATVAYAVQLPIFQSVLTTFSFHEIWASSCLPALSMCAVSLDLITQRIRKGIIRNHAAQLSRPVSPVDYAHNWQASILYCWSPNACCDS